LEGAVREARAICPLGGPPEAEREARALDPASESVQAARRVIEVPETAPPELSEDKKLS